MHHPHFRSLAILSLIAVSGSIFAQETDVAALTRIGNRARIQAQADKQEALRLAPLLGLPVRGEFPNGETYELMAIRGSRPMYFTTNNANAAISTRAVDLYPGGSLGLSIDGTGIVLNEWDGGTVRTTHQELTGRVTIGDAGEPANQDHATHVAGTMIASGVDAAAKGMSYAATLRSFGWTNDTTEMASEATGGMRLSNQSYGYIAGWHPNVYWYWYGTLAISTAQDYGFGLYDQSAADYDDVCYNAPYYLPVKSAGNDRGQGPATQPFGHYDWGGSSWVVDTTGSHNQDGNTLGYDCLPWNATAKNMLIVGAVNDVPTYTGPASVTMSTFSSWGPTDDGRIKPDVVGNGVGVHSSVGSSDSAYGDYSGTSMASPNVTGTLGLLLKHWRNTHSGDLRAATMKALAIHTASECGANDGPDYAFGWGLVNAHDAAQAITLDVTQPNTITERQLKNGQTHTILVYTAGSTLRATMAWTDKPGPVSADVLNPTDLRLVNDLDMRLTGPYGGATTYYPWILDPANPANAATTGDNFRDNVEQIEQVVPAGWYKLEITHKGVLSAPNYQNYSLIFTGFDKILQIQKLTLTPSTVVGSFDIAGKVTLTEPAPPGGLYINLASNSPKATVQPGVVVAAGTRNGSFTVGTLPVGTNVTAAITASLNPSSKSANAYLNPGGLQSFAVNPDTVVGGNASKGTVTLSGAAGVGGTTVTITDDSNKITTPPSTTVAEGNTVKSFNIPTLATVTTLVRSVTAKLGSRTIVRSLTLTP